MSDMLNRCPSEMTQKEFSELFVRYKTNFIVIARSYVRDLTVAEDIVTDSFMAFWNRRHTLAEGTNPPAYIMVTIKNKCLNWLKQQAIHAKVNKEIHELNTRLVKANIASLENCNPERLFEKEVIGIIRRQLASMPDLTRQIFIKSREEERSYRQIAEQFNITPRQVEYELVKAIRSMRLALKDYMAMLFMF